MENSKRIAKRKRLESWILRCEVLIVGFGLLVAVGVVGEWRAKTVAGEKEFSIPVAFGVIGEVFVGIGTLAMSMMAKAHQEVIDAETEKERADMQAKVDEASDKAINLEAKLAPRSLNTQQRDGIKALALKKPGQLFRVFPNPNFAEAKLPWRFGGWALTSSTNP